MSDSPSFVVCTVLDLVDNLDEALVSSEETAVPFKRNARSLTGKRQFPFQEMIGNYKLLMCTGFS